MIVTLGILSDEGTHIAVSVRGVPYLSSSGDTIRIGCFGIWINIIVTTSTWLSEPGQGGRGEEGRFSTVRYLRDDKQLAQFRDARHSSVMSTSS